MNRPLTVVTTLLISLAFCLALAAQTKETLQPLPFSRAPYQAGERLTYNVSFSNFPTAAHIELFNAGPSNNFNQTGFELRAHVETTGAVNAALYSINNDYTTYVNTETGLPYRSQQVVREGGRTADTSREYNVPVGVSAIPARVAFSGPYDFLSAFYRMRALPLTEGSTHFLTVRGDTEQYDIEMRVKGRQLVKTNVGSFNTVVAQVRVRNNPTANDYNIRIYFSDDERHVPVLITARLKAGEVRAELVSSELPSTPPPATTGPPNTAQPRVTGTPLPPGTGVTTGLPFAVGEQLNFNVFLGGTAPSVGTATFQVKQRAKYFNRDGLLLAVQAQTTNAAARLFVANDQINTYVDPTTLLPFRIEINRREGRRRINKTFTIDQDRGNATTDKGVRIEIPVGTHDIVSVLYALRSFNLSPPKRNAVSFIVEDRPRTLFITSLRRETIELGGQRIPAVQLSLTTDDPQSDKYALRLWVSDDTRRLPLRITATTPLGPLRADLAILPLTRQ